MLETESFNVSKLFTHPNLHTYLSVQSRRGVFWITHPTPTPLVLNSTEVGREDLVPISTAMQRGLLNGHQGLKNIQESTEKVLED